MSRDWYHQRFGKEEAAVQKGNTTNCPHCSKHLASILWWVKAGVCIYVTLEIILPIVIAVVYWIAHESGIPLWDSTLIDQVER